MTKPAVCSFCGAGLTYVSVRKLCVCFSSPSQIQQCFVCASHLLTNVLCDFTERKKTSQCPYSLKLTVWSMSHDQFRSDFAICLPIKEQTNMERNLLSSYSFLGCCTQVNVRFDAFFSKYIPVPCMNSLTLYLTVQDDSGKKQLDKSQAKDESFQVYCECST